MNARHVPAEHGYTLIELVATMTILGLILVPLATAAVQSLQLVPASGARTQGGTDRSRLLTRFSDDVANAQQIDFWDTAPTQVAKHPFNTGNLVWSNAVDQGPFAFSCTAGTRRLVTFRWTDQGETATDTRPHTADYQVVLTGTTNRSVVVQRSPDNGATWETFAKGYCSSGTVVTVTGIAPSSTILSTNQEVQMKLTLLDSPTGTASPVTLDGTVRVQSS